MGRVKKKEMRLIFSDEWQTDGELWAIVKKGKFSSGLDVIRHRTSRKRIPAFAWSTKGRRLYLSEQGGPLFPSERAAKKFCGKTTYPIRVKIVGAVRTCSD